MLLALVFLLGSWKHKCRIGHDEGFCVCSMSGERVVSHVPSTSVGFGIYLDQSNSIIVSWYSFSLS